MKTIILLLTLSVLTTCFKPLHASELSVQMIQSSRVADDDVFSTGNWNGLQISYMPNKSGYVWVSQEGLSVYARGKAFDYSMTGLGLGTRYQVSKNFRVFGQFGLYKVKNSWGRQRKPNESMYYYLNRRYYGVHSWSEEYIDFDEYEVRNKDTIGGAFGVELLYPISKHFMSSFMLSYRIMQINDSIAGYKDGWAANRWWETGADRNYSTINFGMTLNYIF